MVLDTPPNLTFSDITPGQAATKHPPKKRNQLHLNHTSSKPLPVERVQYDALKYPQNLSSCMSIECYCGNDNALGKVAFGKPIVILLSERGGKKAEEWRRLVPSSSNDVLSGGYILPR